MTADGPAARRVRTPSATTAATAVATGAATGATGATGAAGPEAAGPGAARPGAAGPAATGAARKRTAATACLAVLPMLAMLAAACQSPSASSSATAGASRPPSGTSAPATSGTSPAGNPTAASGGAGNAAGTCSSHALRAALGPASGAAGSSYVPIRFTNRSETRCTLYGYPGVSFVTWPSGSEVGNPASRMPLTAGPAHVVTITPGSTANAVLQVADAGNYPTSACQPASAPYLRVFPPGQTAALYVRNGYRACASRGVTILHVEPVQSGAGSAGGS